VTPDELEFTVVKRLLEPVTPQPWLPETDLTVEQIRPWILRPIYDRLQGGQSEFLAEVRPITAMFMRFSGIDYDTDEAAGPKLDRYMRWIQQVLEGHGGNLLQFILGDKGCYLLAVFGAPIAHEDDPARAVATALEWQQPPAEFDFISPVKIGISLGRAWVGPCGSPTRHIYTVMGDEINMAARLMSKAEPGQIMVSDVVAVAVAEGYRVEHLGKIQVKGKVEAIGVALVLGRQRSGQQKLLTPFPSPLVGREAELAQLEQILAQCLHTDQGQIIRLEGVMGIGKSHLLSEFASRALYDMWRVVWGYCHSMDENISYTPWQDILRNMFVLTDDLSHEVQLAQINEIVTTMNPAWLVRLPLLGDLLDLDIPDNPTTAAFEPHLRQEALFAFVVDLLAHWANDQPLLILLEDVHWLDEASRRLTLALSRVMTTMPLVLLVIHRPAHEPAILPDLPRGANYHELKLDELPSTDVAMMVAQHLLVGRPAPLVVSLIVHQAKGNPLFVEELVNALRELKHIVPMSEGVNEQMAENSPSRQLVISDIVWVLSEPIMTTLRQANCLLKDSNGQWLINPEATLPSADLGLPDSIHQLVLARFDRLEDDYKLTLKVASAIGRLFGVELLRQAHPLKFEPSVLQQQLTGIEEREFIYLETPPPNLAYMFKHNLTREVAYETLLETQQRQLHQAVAEVIEHHQPEAVEQLAYHYRWAQLREKTLFYLDKAARQAQREYANETALAYYEQALALEENGAWRQGQIEVLHWLGRRAEQKAALELLATNPAAPAFEVAYLWGEYYEAISDYPAAQQAIQQALSAADDLLKRARCLTQFGGIAHKQGEYEPAKSWYQQALTLLEGQPTDTLEIAKIVTEALNGLGVIHRQQSEFEAAKACHERALAFSHRLSDLPGQARALNDLGVAAYYHRHFAEALSYHERALAIRRTIGDRAGEGKSLYNAAMVTLDAGDYGHAKAYLNEALKILQATGNQWDEVNVWNILGVLYQELGDLISAQDSLQKGLDLCKQIGDEAGQSYILINLGLVMCDKDDLEASQNVFLEGLKIAQLQDDKYAESYFISHLAIVSLLANKLEQAIDYANKALNMRREQQLELLATADLATLAAAYLGMGQLTEALSYAQETLTLLDSCEGKGPETPQRDYYVVYEVLTALGQMEEAQRALQAAYDLIQAKAGKIIDESLRHSFLAQVPINRQIVAAWEGVTAGVEQRMG